jgi:hypothetical protein
MFNHFKNLSYFYNLAMRKCRTPYVILVLRVLMFKYPWKVLLQIQNVAGTKFVEYLNLIHHNYPER